MGDFKDEISVALAHRLARELATAWPGFPVRRFTGGLAGALAPLALMARVDLLTERLVDALPQEFDLAAGVLWRTLQSPSFTGWMTLPCGNFVARTGIETPHVALPLLAGLTPRWSSEWPLRPFIERHPDVTYEYLDRWTAHPDEHVRRLVSEGTRPRLPWARQLRTLVGDPGPNLPLLDRLVEDQSAYVRRSVANHLNDISKDHPDIALELAEQWLRRGENATWVVRHGLRTLVKRGDAVALDLLGAAPHAAIRLTDLIMDRDQLAIGEAVVFRFTLELEGPEPADAVVDYRIGYVGADGVRRPKVFKLTRRRLEPGRATTISRRHRFAHVSIRRIRPGRHTIDVQVNGRVLGSASVEVHAESATPAIARR